MLRPLKQEKRFSDCMISVCNGFSTAEHLELPCAVMVHAGNRLVSNTLKRRRVFQIDNIVGLGPMSICKGTVSIHM